MIWLSLALAQVDPRRVAVVVSDDLPPYEQPIEAYVQALGARPRILRLRGREVVAEVEMAALKQTEPDVVFALGAKAAWAVKNALPSTPMVVASVNDPGRYGIVGPQVTGIEALVPPETYLSQVVAFFPEVKQVGVIRGSDDDVSDLQRAADAVGLTVEVRRVDSPKAFRKALHQLARETDAVWIQPRRSYLTPAGFRSAVQELERRQKPLLAGSTSMVTAGAAFAVVPDLDGIGRQAAAITMKLLDGAAPAVIPVEAPVELSTAVNAHTLAEVPHEKLMLDFAEVL